VLVKSRRRDWMSLVRVRAVSTEARVCSCRKTSSPDLGSGISTGVSGWFPDDVAALMARRFSSYLFPYADSSLASRSSSWRL
jgi:hypothetical protein